MNTIKGVAKIYVQSGKGCELLTMNFQDKIGGSPSATRTPVDELYVDDRGFIVGVRTATGTHLFYGSGESECALQTPNGLLDIGEKWGSDVKEKWLTAIKGGLL